MHVIYDNVNDAFVGLVKLFNTGGSSQVQRRSTRNGSVLAVDEPVIITYKSPTRRVLFSAARDANPFFHLYESLWMLAGRNDVTPLAHYSKQMRGYSDDGGTLNGAYGYRWRKACFGQTEVCGETVDNTVDQLDILVAHLKADPTSRRAVLSMWNVEDDLLKIEAHPERSGNFYNPDLKLPASKDICCNLCVKFRLRAVGVEEIVRHAHNGYVLDMTVFNRSNDLIWGALGANVVHFSVLQEYMAARIGVGVGLYNQVTDDLHVYDWNFKPDEWLMWDQDEGPLYEYDDTRTQRSMVPLVKDPAAFEAELPRFVACHDGTGRECRDDWTEPFLKTVAEPMFLAFRAYKEGLYSNALHCAGRVAADDWRIVTEGWLRRRIEKKGVAT